MSCSAIASWAWTTRDAPTAFSRQPASARAATRNSRRWAWAYRPTCFKSGNCCGRKLSFRADQRKINRAAVFRNGCGQCGLRRHAVLGRQRFAGRRFDGRHIGGRLRAVRHYAFADNDLVATRHRSLTTALAAQPILPLAIGFGTRTKSLGIAGRNKRDLGPGERLAV